MKMAKNEKQKKAEALASQIMMLARNSLIVNFRFLDRTISAFGFEQSDRISLATDGEDIYYSPWYILNCYKNEQSSVTRALLHSMLHCVYRHSFIGRDIDRARWDLACDMAVENTITELSSPALYCRIEQTQGAAISTLKEHIGTLTAERIYKWLGDQGFDEEELERQRELFRLDGHGLWYGQSDENAKVDKNVKIKKIWEEIARRMQTELETMQRDKNSALVQNLRSLNRSKRSYSDFLRRFGIHGEVLRLSDDEFDNNYYSYGMELYGNIPLIEPLEYSPQKRIREFVIAIDTSGSVRGDVVQSFIQHTHDILSRQENFFTRVDMHIIQCDDRIQEDVRIRCQEDFERYIKELEIRGLGRTDFRPVFAHVDELRRKGELQNLQGLIYFTDGQGTFPAEKPGYDVAFIIHRNDYAEPALPKWAMGLSISEEDILDKRFSAY